MSFKIPIAKKEVVAVQAILGKTGIIEGKDYRGENVLAGIYNVAGTNWIMIAKIDTSEIFSELWYRAFIITLFTVVSILFLITGVSFVYKYRQSIAYRELLIKEKELRESEEVFRITLYSIGDGVITTDIYGCVKHMNSVAEFLTGWSETESIGKKIEEIFKIINEDSRLTVENPVDRVLREG
ncbi:MAG: PAS domain S-box protein, partial [Melioribacteraceae bacterium]